MTRLRRASGRGSAGGFGGETELPGARPAPLRGARMNILIADDHALLGDGLRLLLQPLDKVVNIVQASTLDEALELGSREMSFDLVLLELGAPGIGGISGLAALRRRLDGVPIVVLGDSGRPGDVLAAIESGANGYLPRTAGGKVLLAALRLVLSGEIYLPSMLLRDPGPGPAESGDGLGPLFPGPLARLTRRQREVLMLLAEGKSNADIARALGVALNTAKNHIKAILKALGASNRTQAVVEAVRLGLRPPGAE